MADSAVSHPSIDAPAPPARQPQIHFETFALVACVYFTLVSNRVVWQHALADRAWTDPATWLFAGCLFTALVALQFGALVLVVPRRLARPVVSVLLLASAAASYFIQTYHVLLDPGMLRNVLAADTKEAVELLSWPLAWNVAWQALLPAWLMWRVSLAPRQPARALLRRALALAAATAAFGLALMLVFQDAAGLARNHREWRYLVTPANVVYSLARVARGNKVAAHRKPIATDARLGPSWVPGRKPTLLVIVVGETVRAANWGLNGYARQTTPELAALDVVNFRDVTSCGTDTEVSLPCMFSPWGRRDYDASRIQEHESLLHVLGRVKLPVLWRDNQSGCKGVCAGLEMQQLDQAGVSGLCADGRCFDEILLHDMDRLMADGDGHRVLVLHQLGNHGPAYHRRYPERFRRFAPTCDTAELRNCTSQQIVNAYDNAVLYTDHVLALTVRFLRAQESTHDTAMIYVSDHGESLGERNLYLHGVPYAIAPKEQTQVPMVMWLSRGFADRAGIDMDCLRERAAKPASHDHLFHTVLGMLDVQTASYDGLYDLTRPCRR